MDPIFPSAWQTKFLRNVLSKTTIDDFLNSIFALFTEHAVNDPVPRFRIPLLGQYVVTTVEGFLLTNRGFDCIASSENSPKLLLLRKNCDCD